MQSNPIPWTWTNKLMPDNTVWVSGHPGVIEMPDLVRYFDWQHFAVDCPGEGSHFKLGTRNMKSTFTTAARFLGYEKLLTEQPDLTSIADAYYEWNKKLLLAVSVITYFEIGDDIAGNTGLMMSPDLWRTWIRPHFSRLIDLAKSHGCFVIYHSDGDLSEIIGDLLELRIDALHCERGKMDELLNQGRFGEMEILEHDVRRDD